MSHDDGVSRSKSRVVAAILLAMTFATGVVAGIAGDRIVLVRQARILPREGMRIVSARIVHAMDHELDLTDPQRAEVARILEARRQRIEGVWAGIRPQVRTEIDRSNREIEAVLTAEQKPKFQELMKRWEQRMERLLGRQAP